MPAAPTDPPIAVRVVSLAGSPRRVGMAAQLGCVPGLDWAFFDACETLPPGLRHDPAATRSAIGRDLTRGELGCYASHWSLWTWVGTRPSGTILIVLEDDLLIDPGFFANLPQFAASLPRIPYLRLHAKAPAAARVIGRVAGRHLVRYRGMAFGTQAYLVRQPAAARFAARLAVIDRPVDDAMDRYWASGVPSHGVFPFPVLELAGPSTIEAARRAPPGSGVAGQRRRVTEALRRTAANFRLKAHLPL